MSSRNVGLPPWLNVYPVADKTGSGSPEHLFVDIGGNMGHVAVAFRKKFPDLPGKVVVQDLPHVIEDVTEEFKGKGVEFMGCDFFQPQPIEGTSISPES
jgi:hypothetical protein